jgi:hypothetical protein
VFVGGFHVLMANRICPAKASETWWPMQSKDKSGQWVEFADMTLARRKVQ